MPLLLAIEPDARQAACLTAVLSAHLTADLVLASSVDQGLAALGPRRPDLVLTAASLSSTAQAELTASLAARGPQHPAVPTLAIQHFANDPAPQRGGRGLLARLRRPRARRGTPDCAPAAFAGQIAECLALADAVRRAYADATTGGRWNVGPLPGDGVAAASLDLQVIVESERADEPVVDAGWLDLEPYLDDEASATGTPRARAADGAPEPDVIELPPPDELWAQLSPGYAAHMAPLEGPSMSPKTPQPPTRQESATTETATRTSGSLRLLRPHASADRPMQDEWGLYDPEQCGFAALLVRLGELADDDRRESERSNRSAIMRR